LRTVVANLNLETARNGTVAIVSPSGELDLSGAGLLEAELERLERDPGLAAVVLDLRGLEFMDSTGLRLVILADQRARAAGRRLALVHGPDAVRRVFDVTQMTDRLDFVADPGDVR
jgi:anti-sigma B factor antagonist